MPKVIDREMIIDFSQGCDESVADNAFYVLEDYFDDISLSLSSINSMIKVSNVNLVKAFDYASNTATATSELDVFIAIKSAQIELNSIEKMTGLFNKIKMKLIDAWERVKNSKKRAVKKRLKEEKQKQKKGLTQEDLLKQNTKPYSIISFKDDCFNALITKMSPLTIIYNLSNKIQLLSSEELGINVNLYPVIHLGQDYKLWNKDKASFKIIRPFEASNAIKEKNLDIRDDNVLKLIRIYKSMYFNIHNNNNYRFTESLVVNLPDNIFDDEDIYEVFLKSINYLNNTDISNYKSIYNRSKVMFEEDGISYYDLKNFLKEISKLI